MESRMDWNWHPFSRAEGDICRSNEGRGNCMNNATCVGVSYPNEPFCPEDPPEIQCCFVKRCTVPEGKGFCRSARNNGCPDGELFPGSREPWPCPGGDDIQCCVKSADMVTSTTFTGTPNPTDGSDQTATSSPAPDENSRLSGGQIAGISVGVAAAVILVVIGALWIYIRRRRAQRLKGMPSAAEAGGSEKVELPGDQKTVNAELPDTGPVVAVSRGRDDKKDVVAPAGSGATRVELPSPSNPPPQLSRPPVELDATENTEDKE